jgi:hypothetical protein
VVCGEACDSDVKVTEDEEPEEENEEWMECGTSSQNYSQEHDDEKGEEEEDEEANAGREETRTARRSRHFWRVATREKMAPKRYLQQETMNSRWLKLRHLPKVESGCRTDP